MINAAYDVLPGDTTQINGNTRIGHRYRLPNLQTKMTNMADIEASKSRASKNGGILRLVLGVTFGLALLAGIIFLVAGYAGAELARAGHTINTKLRTISIGSDTITIPGNMIRYSSQRRATRSKRLDIYLHWPGMNGYSEELKSEFNNNRDNHNIVFVTLAPRFSTFDMSARINPIYRKFFTGENADIGNGLIAWQLDSGAGFIDERLVVQKDSPYPFAARCVSPGDTGTKPYCIRDIHIGKELSLTYRFHEKLLPQWLSLDRSIRNKFKLMIGS